MIIIGITGSIGMGKSTIALMLKSFGIPIHDSDKVVKKLLDEHSKNEEFLIKFKSEANIYLMLNHPNIVSLKDFIIKNNSFYLVQEYVEGQNLEEYIQNVTGPIPSEVTIGMIKDIVEAIEKNARNNIELTLDGVFDFINNHKPAYNPQYKVFNEQFVLCWAGEKKLINDEIYFSRVDIELINEQVKLFFSALDDVQISYNQHSFIITEYIYLGLEKQEELYPLEKTIINFKENGQHDIVKEFLFVPPKFDVNIIHHIYNDCNAIVKKIENNIPLSVIEDADVLRLPTNYLICYLHGYVDVSKQLKKVKTYLKDLKDKTTYIKYKEAMRVIRKVQYH